MSFVIQQDGVPYLPEPDEKKYPGITNEEPLREYLRALIMALREYILIQKADADNLAAPGLSGTKIYYVSDTNGGAVNRKLTFLNGILTAET